MPSINTTPRADLDTATDRLNSTAIALAFLVSLPEGQRAGYVKALLRFRKARQQYHVARDAYLTAYPHRAAATPVLVVAQ